MLKFEKLSKLEPCSQKVQFEFGAIILFVVSVIEALVGRFNPRSETVRPNDRNISLEKVSEKPSETSISDVLGGADVEGDE